MKKYIWNVITLVGLFLTATRVDPTSLTSWQVLGNNLWVFISNPFLIGTFILAVLGWWNNPRTPGLGE